MTTHKIPSQRLLIQERLKEAPQSVQSRYNKSMRSRIRYRIRKWFVVLGRFIIKEFLHIFRDPRTLAIILGLPVVLIIIFGFALTTDVGEIKLLVVTPEKNEFVSSLAQKLDANESLKVLDIVPPSKDYDELFRKIKVDAILRLEGDFEKKLIRGEVPQMELSIDGVDPSLVASGTSVIGGVVKDFFLAEASTKGSQATQGIKTSVTLLFNPEMKASYYFVPGVMGLVLMIICAMMTSVSIVREKESGSMEILLSSPVHPGVIILAKAMPYFILSCFNIITILLLSHLVLKVPILGSVSALIFLCMLFILVSLLLGLFISTVTKSQLNAIIISGAGLMLPVAMLSGMIFPLESMPRILFYIAQVVPATWFVAGVKKLMLMETGWADVQMEIYILLGMAVLLVSVAVLTFKNRLE